MMAAKPHPRMERLALTFEQALTPIFVFAFIAAPLCWAGAWFFRETYEFSAMLLALGGLPLVVAVCAYLLVLVNKVERKG
jgi:hypothetical protein